MSEDALIDEGDVSETPPGGPPVPDDQPPVDDTPVDEPVDDVPADAPASDAPDTPEDYKLPDIEGFDHDQANASPVFSAIRRAAHKAGLGQEAFEGAIQDYVDETISKSTEAKTAEMAKLGANAKARLSAVSSYITSKLPAAQAEALRRTLTTADSIKALETLMGVGTRKTSTSAPVAQSVSREEIEKLMATKSYMGRPNERDQKVIDKVDAWFANEARQKAKA